jgi:hypothetical protein
MGLLQKIRGSQLPPSLEIKIRIGERGLKPRQAISTIQRSGEKSFHAGIS